MRYTLAHSLHRGIMTSGMAGGHSWLAEYSTTFSAFYVVNEIAKVNAGFIPWDSKVNRYQLPKTEDIFLLQN